MAQDPMKTGDILSALAGDGIPTSTNSIDPKQIPSSVDPRDVFADQVKRSVPDALGSFIPTDAQETRRYLDNDYGFLPSSIRDNEDFYAKYQSSLEKIGSGAAKLVGLTVTKLGTGVGFLLGLANPVNWFDEDGYISSAADNAVAKTFEGMEDYLKNESIFTTYQEAEDRDKGFFRRAISDLDFWTDDLVDGAAFMASAFVPGMLLSKANLGVKLAQGLSRFGVGAEGAGAVITGAETTTNYLKYAPQIAKTFDKTTMWALSTASESMFEAKGIRDKVKADLQGKINPETERFYTDAEINKIAGESAKNGFVMNMGLLGLSNLMEINYLYKALGKSETAANKIVSKGIGEGFEVAKPKTWVGKFFETNAGKLSKGLSVNVLREGLWEENAQLAIQRFNEEYGTAGKVLGFSDYLGVIDQFRKQTGAALSGEDQEAAMNIGIGGLLGGAMGAVGDFKQSRRDKVTTENVIDILNKSQQSWLKFGNIYQTKQEETTDVNGNRVKKDTLVLDKNNKPIIDNEKLAAALSGLKINMDANNQADNKLNPLEMKLYRDHAFSEFVMAHIEAGIESTINDKLDSAAKASPEELIKLGFDPSGDVKQQVENYKNLSNRIIAKNRIIERDVLIDDSKEDKARKNHLKDLVAKQAVFEGIVDEIGKQTNELKLNFNNDANTSISDGLVDQLNEITYRINSQKDVIEELTKANKTEAVDIYKKVLSDLEGKLEQIKKDNPESLKTIKQDESGFYLYEKEDRNNVAFKDQVNGKLKNKGEILNEVLGIGFLFAKFSDTKNGKKNYLAWLKNSVVDSVNQVLANQPVDDDEVVGNSFTFTTKDKNGNDVEVTVTEGQEYITEFVKKPRVYKNAPVTTEVYEQDLIRIISIDDKNIIFTINNSGSFEQQEALTFTKEEFAEMSGKLVPMKDLSPTQRIYFKNRNVVFDLNVRAKTGKRHLIKGTYADKDYSDLGTVVQARLDMVQEFTEVETETGDKTKKGEWVIKITYINPVTKQKESFDYDPDYLRKYAKNKQNLFLITDSEEEYLEKDKQKRLNAQVNILNDALNEIIGRLDSVITAKQQNEEEYLNLKIKLDEYLKQMDELTKELSKTTVKKGRKTKARKELEARQQELAALIAETNSLVSKYETEIENLEKELETLEKIYGVYEMGINEIQENNAPFTRDETGSIIPSDIQAEVRQLEQSQLIKPKRNISNERLDQMITDVENEMNVLQERIDTLKELLARFDKITNLDKVPDVLDALENIDDKGQLLMQLNLIKRQESDPAKQKIIQDFIYLISRRGESIEAAYLFDIADRYREAEKEIKQIQEKLNDIEDKALRLYTARDQRNAIDKVKERANQYKIIQDELVRVYKIRLEKAGIKREGDKIIVPAGTVVEDELIQGVDAILSTQPIEDLSPEGQTEKDSFKVVEGRIPILTEFALFKTAGRHFADLGDTSLNSPEDARFFKFSETAILRNSKGVAFYLIPITKDSKQYQDLRVTSWEEDGKKVEYDDDIRLVVVTKDASGEFRPVDINGNILENPTRDNMIYTAMLGHPDLMSGKKELVLSWLQRNFINKNDLSEDEQMQIVDRFVKTRNEIKDRVKKGEPIFLPIEDKSPGVYNREPLGYTEDGKTRPQELSLEGRLIEDNPDFSNLKHPDGSPIRLTVTTFNSKVKAGRLLMVKENDPNTSVLVYNRQFNKTEQENIINILKRMAELFGLKSAGLLTDESEAREFELGIKYLQGVIHWFSPVKGFAPYSFQMWVNNGLHFGENVVKFTPEEIEANKEKILAAIPYHKVNNSMLDKKRMNDSFTEVTVIDGKIKAAKPYINYQHYLLADREGGPIVYTNIKPFVAPSIENLEPHSYQLKNVYLRYGVDGILSEPPLVLNKVNTANSNTSNNKTTSNVVNTYSVIQKSIVAPGGIKMVEMTNNIPLGPKLTFVKKRNDGITELYIHTEYVDNAFKIVQVVDENGQDFTDQTDFISRNEEGINLFMSIINDEQLKLVKEEDRLESQDKHITSFFKNFIRIEDFSNKGNVQPADIPPPPFETGSTSLQAPVSYKPKHLPIEYQYNIPTRQALTGKLKVPLEERNNVGRIIDAFRSVLHDVNTIESAYKGFILEALSEPTKKLIDEYLGGEYNYWGGRSQEHIDKHDELSRKILKAILNDYISFLKKYGWTKGLEKYTGEIPERLAHLQQPVSDNESTPIEGLNERLDAYGNAIIVFSSDFYEGERPKGKLNGFKFLLAQLRDNIIVLADVNWNNFDFFLSKEDIGKLNALKPLAKELDTINSLKITRRDTRTVAVEKRYAQLSNQLVNEFVDIVGKHVKQQLGKTITSSKPKITALQGTQPTAPIQANPLVSTKSATSSTNTSTDPEYDLFVTSQYNRYVNATKAEGLSIISKEEFISAFDKNLRKEYEIVKTRKAIPAVVDSELEDLLKLSDDDTSGRIDPNARIGSVENIEKENINEFRKWVEKVLPQFPVEITEGLVDGRFMGQFYMGAIRLSELSEKGTGYHEAFEAVWNALLTPAKQSELIKEYRNRPNYQSQEFYKWAVTNYPFLSEERQIKEALAEEFRAYMLSDGNLIIPQSPKRNTFFRKIINFIKKILGMKVEDREELDNKIQSLFSQIAKGEFAGNDVVPTYDPKVKNNKAVPGTSVEFSQQLMDGMTATFFSLMYQNNNNVQELFDKNNDLFSKYYKETYRKVYDTFRPGYRAAIQSDVYAKMSEEKKQAFEEAYVNKRLSEDPLYQEKMNALNQFSGAVKDLFKRHLSQFGLSFTESKLTDEEFDEMMEKEEAANTLIRDVIYVDPTTLTAPSVRLLILSLTADIQDINGDVIAQEKNGLGLISLVPYKRKMNTLLNELSNIVPVMRRQPDGSYKSVSALDQMFEKLKEKFSDPERPARYKSGYEWINKLMKRLKYDQLKNGSVLGDDELRLLVAFENAFNRNLNLPLKVIVGANGKVRHVNAISVNMVQKIKEEWRNNIKDKALKTDVSNLVNAGPVIVNEGGFMEVNLDSRKLSVALNAQESDFKSVLEALSILGIKFSIPSNRFSFKDETDIKDAFRRMRGVLRERQTNKQKFYYSEFFDRKTVEGPLNSLLAIEANQRSEDTLLSHLTPEGKTQYAVTLQSEISNVLNSLRGISTIDEFVISNPQYGSVSNGTVKLHPYLQNSEFFRLGGMFFDGKGNKKKDIDYEYIQGMAADINYEGESTDRMTFPDKIVQEIYHLLRGSYFTIINSDKSSEFAINFGHFIKPSEISEFSRIEEKYLNALRDEVLHAAHFYFRPNNIDNHQDNILMLGHFSNVLGFNKEGNGSRYQKYFMDLIKDTKINKRTKPEVVDQLINNIADNFTSVIKNEGVIKNYVDSQVADTKKWLMSEKIVSYDESNKRYKTLSIPVDNAILGSDVLSMDELQYTKLVRFMVVNRQLNVYEQHKLFYGHPALYNQLPKRSSGANSQKNSVSENVDVIEQMNITKPRYDGRVRNAERPVVKSITYDDPEVVSNKVKSIAEALYQGYLPFMDKKKIESMIGAKFDKDGKLVKIQDDKGTLIRAYTKMTEADGQSYIMPDYFRDLLYLSSILSPEQEALLDYEFAEEVIDRNNSNHPYHKQYDAATVAKAREILSQPKPKAIIQPLKPQGFGFALSDNMTHTNMLKNSVFPLTWSRVKNNPTMLAKYISAQNQGVDVINFVSGHKVGAVKNSDGSFTSMYNPDGSISEDVPLTIDIISKYVGIQVETPDYAKNVVIFGSQIRKIILSNLPAELEVYREEYMSILDEMINREFQQLLKDLGVELVNGIYTTTDFSKTMSKLREQAIARNLPDTVVDMLETVEVNFKQQPKYPLDANPARERIEYVLMAMVDNSIVRMEMFGKSSVQVASTMWEQGKRNLMYIKDGVWENVTDYDQLTDKEKKTVKLTSNDLSFYSGEQGYMEVYLPWYFEGIDPEKAGFKLENGIWKPKSPEAMEKLLRAVGFRIPTQAMNMIESILIKGFLDPSYGDMIVVPSEMVGKSGSDFDIDKLNIFLANYIVRAGKIEYLNYSDAQENVKERYVEYINETAEKDVRKLLEALSSSDRNKLKEEFQEKLDRIKEEASLEYSSSKNSIKDDFREKMSEYVAIEEDNDEYFRELFRVGRELYWSLSDETILTFDRVKDYIKAQNIQGPREIQLYLEHAVMLREADLFKDDNAILDNMITIYEQELKVLGNTTLVMEYVQNLKKHFKERKNQLYNDIKNKKISSITDILDEKDTEYFNIRFEMATEMARIAGLTSFEEFQNQPIRKQNTKKRLQNRLIEIMRTILEHPANRRQLLVPNTTAKLKQIAEVITKLRGKTIVENDMTKLSEWKSMAETRETFVTSKQLVGSGALQITSHVMSQIGEIELTGYYKDFDGKVKESKIKLKNNNSRKLDLIIDSENEFIFDLLSQALSGSVDAAKDPFIFEIRLNLDTADTWFYLTKRGVSQMDIALMFNQPIVDDFFKLYSLNNTFVNQANDSADYFNTLVINAGKKYYEAATGTVIPVEENPRSTINRFRAIQEQFNKFSTEELTEHIGAEKLTPEQAKKQVALLMDMLDYREQASKLTNFIKGIGYDTTKTKTVAEAKLQQFRYNKIVNDGFINAESLDRVFDKTFLRTIKNYKDNLHLIFKDFFISLDPKVYPAFEPLMKQLDYPGNFMKEDDKKQLINRYQSFLLTYILQNTPNGREKAIKYNFDLFQDTSSGESFPKLLKKLKERYPKNIALQNLFPILNENRNLTDNIKLFNNKLTSYEVNLISESLESLQNVAITAGDIELQKFLDNLATFTLLQSGLQMSPITFTKILPLSMYADVAANIFNTFKTSYETIDVDNVWRTFHQNYIKNSNIVPLAKRKRTKIINGLFTVSSGSAFAGYDYVKVWEPKDGISQDDLNSDTIPFEQKYEIRLYEKIKIIDNGEDVTLNKPSVKYRRINILGNGMYFLETMPKDPITGVSHLEGIYSPVDESIYDDAVKEHIEEMLSLHEGSSTPTLDLVPMKDASTATMTYAGVGSRTLPADIEAEIRSMAKELDGEGFTVNTGEVRGTDKAFRDSHSKKNIFKKEDATDITRQIAMEVHPRPEALDRNGLDLMARNTFQVFGADLRSLVDFVLAYDPEGWEGTNGLRPEKGGTNQAIDLATRKGIPVINIANPNWKERVRELVKDIKTRKFVKPVNKKPTVNTTRSSNRIINTVVENYSRFEDAKDAYRKGDGVWSMRPNKDVKMDADAHYGNPWSTPKDRLSPETIVVQENEEAITNYRNWIEGTAHQNIQPKRREWIVNQINEGKLDNKKLIYYKPGNYVSHADVLADMVNSRSKSETPPFDQTPKRQLTDVELLISPEFQDWYSKTLAGFVPEEIALEEYKQMKKIKEDKDNGCKPSTK